MNVVTAGFFHLSIADYNSSSNITFTCKMTLIREHLDEYVCIYRQGTCISESVDSLCRDGTDKPIVRVHWNIHGGRSSVAYSMHVHSSIPIKE